MAGFALPQDADGEIQPHDHPDLQGDRRMIRGVSQMHVVWDANRGCNRLSSALFRCRPKHHGYLSFDSEHCLIACGEDPLNHISQSEWDGAVVITVERFRSFDPAQNDNDRWKIGMVPLFDEEPPKPCHGAVWGSITEGRANDIRRAVAWLVELPDVVLDETTLPLAQD